MRQPQSGKRTGRSNGDVRERNCHGLNKAHQHPDNIAARNALCMQYGQLPRLLQTHAASRCQQSLNPSITMSRSMTCAEAALAVALLERCVIWCKRHRLLAPTPHDIAAAMRSACYLRHKSNGQRLRRSVTWRAEPDPLITIAEPDMLRRLHPNPVIPLRVFCRLAGVGRSTFYVQKQRNDAPMSHRRGRGGVYHC